MAGNDLIDMPYWKFFPEKVLLSEKIGKMTTQQFGGYWLIVCRVKLEPMRGVTEFQEQKLFEWTRLKKKAVWKRERQKILSPFSYHPATGTLHHGFVQSLFYEHIDGKNKFRAWGKQGGETANGKKHGTKGGATPPTPSPYARFKPPFIHLSAEDIDLDRLFLEAKTLPASTLPQGGVLGGSSPYIVSNEVSYSTQQTTPVGGVVAGGGDDEDGGKPLGTILREKAAKAIADQRAEKAGRP